MLDDVNRLVPILGSAALPLAKPRGFALELHLNHFLLVFQQLRLQNELLADLGWLVGRQRGLFLLFLLDGDVDHVLALLHVLGDGVVVGADG